MGKSTAQALSFLLDVNISAADLSNTGLLGTTMVGTRGGGAGPFTMLPNSLLDIGNTTTSASQAIHSWLERYPAISADAQCSVAKRTTANCRAILLRVASQIGAGQPFHDFLALAQPNATPGAASHLATRLIFFALLHTSRDPSGSAFTNIWDSDPGAALVRAAGETPVDMMTRAITVGIPTWMAGGGSGGGGGGGHIADVKVDPSQQHLVDTFQSAAMTVGTVNAATVVWLVQLAVANSETIINYRNQIAPLLKIIKDFAPSQDTYDGKVARLIATLQSRNLLDPVRAAAMPTSFLDAVTDSIPELEDAVTELIQRLTKEQKAKAQDQKLSTGLDAQTAALAEVLRGQNTYPPPIGNTRAAPSNTWTAPTNTWTAPTNTWTAPATGTWTSSRP